MPDESSPERAAEQLEDDTQLSETHTWPESLRPAMHALKLPCRFGGYTLLEKIGEGGMGVVYKAQQQHPNRIVALKLIRPDKLSAYLPAEQAKLLARFRNEIQAAAKLENDHVVTIYDVGEFDGQSYYAMRYVDGKSLRELVNDGPLKASDAARYIQQVAMALVAAHEASVLHRDLKPHNVLVDRKSDRALLADFGLAKLEESQLELTATEAAVGTPPYMSPEQTLGNQVTAASDIYSLGATLYCLLTGRPPFQAANSTTTMLQVQSAEPANPRAVNPSIPRDLETICLKCLRKEPHRRYASATELADDLGRWLENKPIRARRVGLAEKGWLWCKRRPAVAGLIAAVLLVVIGASTSIGMQRYQNALQRRENEQARQLNERRNALARLENDQRRAASLVQAVLSAPPAAVPYAVAALEPLREHAVPILKSKCDDETLDATQRLHAACALTEFGHIRGPQLLSSICDAPKNEGSNIARALRYMKGDAVEHVKKSFDAEQQAARCVRWATILLHLGDTSASQQMLSLGPSPMKRSAFIHGLAQWHGNATDFIQPLRETNDEDFRSGLCLAIGLIPLNELTPTERQKIGDVLLQLYRTAPGGAAHSACDWALRKWKLDLPQIAGAREVRADCDWYVNTLGMTMVKIPAGGFARHARRVTLTKAFLVCNREVSVGQFERFIADEAAEKPKDWRGVYKPYSPTGEHPVNTVSWNAAVSFCNWLSEKESLTPCYQRTAGVNSNQRDEWHIVTEANGYRLLTEAEWEFACRAQTTTEFCFGSDELLGHYAVCRASKPQICASKMPNGWGLFDMHGNIDEWCWDWFGSFESNDLTDPLGPSSGTRRVSRGGSFATSVESARSAQRNAYPPAPANLYNGFRVARNYP